MARDTIQPGRRGEGLVDIGKVLDTSDDKARLTIITAREGEKKDVRVLPSIG